ncbi:MAG: DNA repair protein RadC [Acidobacteriota bacterium]
MAAVGSAKRVSEKWVSYWPASERPRERLLTQGASALSDAELLAIFLRVGVRGMSVVDLSRHLLREFGGLRGLFGAQDQQLRHIRGMGPAKIATLRAIGELSQRCLQEKVKRETLVECSGDVYKLLEQKFRDLKQEIFSVVFLDTKHRVLAIENMFQGTINTASVFPREVVKRALDLGAAAIIAVHNHPSGNPDPSSEDRRVTEDLRKACELLELSLLDHIIVGANGYFSFADRRLLT